MGERALQGDWVGDSGMISVRRFSLQGSVWRQHAPMMEQVVRWINGREVVHGRAVRVGHGGARSAVIAETAFRRVAAGVPLFGENEEQERNAASLLALLPPGQFGDLPLDRSERLEVMLIQRNLLHYCDSLSDPTYFFRLQGCGVVDAAYGDIHEEGHLVEVKTVARAFRGTDLRQLLVYCAMSYASGISINSVSLYNPRRGRLFSSTLDELTHGVSGSSSVELMQDLVNAMVGFQVSA